MLFTCKSLTCKRECLPHNASHLVSTLLLNQCLRGSKGTSVLPTKGVRKKLTFIQCLTKLKVMKATRHSIKILMAIISIWKITMILYDLIYISGSRNVITFELSEVSFSPVTWWCLEWNDDTCRSIGALLLKICYIISPLLTHHTWKSYFATSISIQKF